jgi:hypothetical protein
MNHIDLVLYPKFKVSTSVGVLKWAYPLLVTLYRACSKLLK